MIIAGLCVYSLLLVILSLAYLAYPDYLKECKDIKNAIITSFNNKKRNVYIVISFIMLCAMSIILPILYQGNSLIDNFKLITLLGIIFVAAYIDYEKHIIPNKLVLVGVLVRFILYVIEFFIRPDNFLSMLKNNLFACVIIVFFLVVGMIIVKNGIGMGDIKLMLVMCLFQGFYGVLNAILYSLIAAFFLSIGLLLTKKKTRKDSIAFAPAILVGTYISIFLTGM